MVATSALSQPIDAASLRQLLGRAEVLNEAVLRLGTGNRVLAVEDDVISLTLAQGLRGDASALRETYKAVAQATSLLQVAARGTDGVATRLDALSLIAQKAGGASLLTSERAFLQAESDRLVAEIDTLAQDTTFEGVELLDGTLTTSFRLGSEADNTLSVTLDSVASDVLFAGDTLDMTSVLGADDAVALVASARDIVGAVSASITAAQSRLSFADLANTNLIEGLNAGGAAIGDTDVGAEGIRYVSLLAAQNASLAVLSQTRRLDTGLIGLLASANAAS